MRQFLYYRPDDALLHRFDSGSYVMSVSAGTDVWRMAPPHIPFPADGFLAVSGVPTLEALHATRRGPFQGAYGALLRSHGPDRVYETVGGSFSVGCLDVHEDGGLAVAALSDFSGLQLSCSTLILPEYFAVGNRASFVGAFRTGYPGRNEIDANVLSWLVGTTMIMGTKTPFSACIALTDGVPHLLLRYVRGRIRSGVRVVERMSPHHFGSGGLGSAPRTVVFIWSIT